MANYLIIETNKLYPGQRRVAVLENTTLEAACARACAKSHWIDGDFKVLDATNALMATNTISYGAWVYTPMGLDALALGV